MEQEVAQGNATALGLSLYLQKFIATLLVLSADVLVIIGNLSCSFQTKMLWINSLLQIFSETAKLSLRYSTGMLCEVAMRWALTTWQLQWGYHRVTQQ